MKKERKPRVYDVVPDRVAMKRIRQDQCPFCAYPDTERDGSGDESRGFFYQESSCNNPDCGKTWHCSYKLTTVS